MLGAGSSSGLNSSENRESNKTEGCAKSSKGNPELICSISILMAGDSSVDRAASPQVRTRFGESLEQRGSRERGWESQGERWRWRCPRSENHEELDEMGRMNEEDCQG